MNEKRALTPDQKYQLKIKMKRLSSKSFDKESKKKQALRKWKAPYFYNTKDFIQE